MREWGGETRVSPPPDSISCHFVSSWSFDLKIEYDRAERHTLEALFSDSDLGLTGPPPAELLGPSKIFGTSGKTISERYGMKRNCGRANDAECLYNVLTHFYVTYGVFAEPMRPYAAP